MPKFTQTIIWTVLPNGAAPPQFNFPNVKQPPVFNFSVLVSPRLFVDASDAPPGSPALSPTLELFPDFLDWPSRKITFKVRFGSMKGPAMENPVEAARVGPPPDSALWRAVFRKTTAVRPYVFRRLDQSFIYSYPGAAVNEFLKHNYADLSTSDTTPSVLHILDKNHFGPIVLPPEFSDKGDQTRPIAERMKLFDEELKSPEKHPDSPVNQKTPLADFLKLMLFHQPRTPKEPEAPAPPVEPPAPDFHDLLAHLGEYPTLLRSLGLVIDLSIPAPQNAADVVMLAPEFQPAPQNKLGAVAHANVTPRTRYKATTTAPLEFRALDHPDSDIAAGLLKLSDKDRFGVVQIDADGAGIKAFNLANNLAEATSARKTSDTPTQAGLPVIRSGGIAVVRNGRAGRFQSQMARAFQMNEAAESKPAAPKPGEAAKPPDPSRGITLTAPDLVRGYRVDVREVGGAQPGPWRSLCERDERYEAAAPPGGVGFKSAVKREEGFVTASVGSRAVPPAEQSKPPEELYLQETLFRWEGWSLCVRRPGLPLASRPEEAQKTVTPGQPDPPADPPSAGKSIPLDVRFSVAPGSLPRLRFGGQYQLRARAVDLAGNGLRLNQPGEAATTPLTYARFEPVAPPKLLRGSPKKDGDSLERVVIRTGSAVGDKDSALRHAAPPPVGQLLAETHGVFDALAPAAAYALIKQRDHEVESPKGPESSEKVLPAFPSADPADKEHLYLPDPAASGVIVRLEGAPVEGGPFHFYGGGNAWPDFKPLRIDLKTADKGGGFVCKLDPVNRVLTVRLLPSQVVRLQLSSLLTKEDLLKMGVFRWIQELAPPDRLGDLEKLFKRGISTINPFREVVLVHAVQQPLEAPQFSGLKAVRQSQGQTGAALSGALKVHGASTVRVDLLAEWEEPTGRGVAVDKAKKLGAPEMRKGKAHVGELAVRASASQVDFSSIPAVRHEFGDTKHRVVHYTARGTTRFREYFIGELGNKPPPVLTRDSQPVEVKIPSSARPAAPGVQYVIPSFRWARAASKEGDSHFSVRLGGGLRVYLDGPWFSSGEGELLGVVTSQAVTTGATPARLRPFVTQWGEDPVWKKGGGVPAFMAAELFATRVLKAEDLPLAEVPDPPAGESVNVAAHEVKFDGSRWYSDINLHFKPGEGAPTGELPVYFPFIRLALARYQPNSLPGLHLSRVTLADFAQLVPDRMTYVHLATAKAGPTKFSTALTAKLTAQQARLKGPSESLRELMDKALTPAAKNTVFVAVAGVTHARAPQNVVSAVLQRATSPRKSELDWEAASPVVTLTFSPDASLPFIGRWLGKLDLPADFKPGSFRVLVSEAEIFAADQLDARGRILQTKPSGATVPSARVVYTDTVEI